MKKSLFLSFFCILNLYFFSCTKVSNLPYLNQEDSPNLSKTVVVIGIRWEEKNRPTKALPAYKITSESLLEDATNIEKKRTNDDPELLEVPLHYIYDQEFFFSLQTQTGEEKLKIEKSNKNLASYPIYSIHQIDPGVLDLKNLEQRVQLLSYVQKGEVDLFHETPQAFPLPPLQWEVKAGQIYYLGEITLTFSNDRYFFGLFTPKLVNGKIEPALFKLEDNFADWQAQFLKNNPWFPVAKTVNASQNLFYSFKNQKWQKTEKEEVLFEKKGSGAREKKLGTPIEEKQKKENNFW